MIFRIKAGRHAANNRLRWRILRGNVLRFRFRFLEGYDYEPSQVLNGWSKLFGIGSPLIHRNSCRIVWRNTEKGLRAGIYIYNKGVSPQENTRFKQDIGEIVPGAWYEVNIIRGEKRWDVWFSREGGLWQSIGVSASFWWPFKWHYVSHPWVGGRFTIDKDVIIEIEKITA